MKPQRGPWCPWIWFSKSWQIFGQYHKDFFVVSHHYIIHQFQIFCLCLKVRPMPACCFPPTFIHKYLQKKNRNLSMLTFIQASLLYSSAYPKNNDLLKITGDQGKNLKSGQVQLKMKTLPNDCTSDIHKSNTQCGLH